MLRYVFILLLFISTLHADFEDLFSESQDPCVVHHVNVISGQLSFSGVDTVVQGPDPFPVTRSYSSSGAFERLRGEQDRIWSALQNNLDIKDGWSFMPELHLMIERGTSKKSCKAYLSEGSGFIEYVYDEQKDDYVYLLKPDKTPNLSSEIITARNQIQNYRLKIEAKKGRAILYLPTGGTRVYKGPSFTSATHYPLHFNLEQVRSPNGRIIDYEYDKHGVLRKIAFKNPSGSKTFSWIDFKFHRTSGPFPIEMLTSDDHFFKYGARDWKERHYLNEVEGSCRPKEVCYYTPSRKGAGLRVSGLNIGGHIGFVASYADGDGDKVTKIQGPVGPNGDLADVASFHYEEGHTDVRDAYGILIRYHHNGERLREIEYFDKEGRLYSAQRFFWKGTRLSGKALIDEHGNGIFSKTFTCDKRGNIEEEILSGNLTGESEERFDVTDEGKLIGAKSYWKRYTYDDVFNLPLREEEENSLVTCYQYKPQTDLLEAKFICEYERILKREFCLYDDDHLLIAEIVDDGSSEDRYNLQDVSERHITRYEYYPFGLPKTIATYYLEDGREQLLLRKEIRYTVNHQIASETIFDAEGRERYKTHSTYNELGCLTSKTDPLGQENHYDYNELGTLKWAKEIGSPEMAWHYDRGGRKVEEIRNNRVKKISYDTKSHPIQETDELGNITTREYDGFGRCIKTREPKTHDENGDLYHPKNLYEYDIQGNVAVQTNAREESVHTHYTTLNKPYRIIQHDGTEACHVYAKNGVLLKSILADRTEIHYKYDIFQRVISKKIFSRDHQILSSETWVYNTFHLLSYTDPKGLTTTYTYDKAGRLICERAEDRTQTYVYDALGFLERHTAGAATHVELHDVMGRVIEEWVEDDEGRIENKTTYTYENNHKKTAKRQTSQGESLDEFFYNSDGKLERHTNPEGFSSHFIYYESQNEIGQKIWNKKTIDPKGNILLETCDVFGRAVLIERFGSNGEKVLQQQLFYDRAGNKAKLIQAGLTHRWTYDSSGNVTELVESHEKITRYRYFPSDRIEETILPDGVVLSSQFDGLGRLIEQKSSDGSIHTRTRYSSDHAEIHVHDLVSDRHLTRTYNRFGELTEESTGSSWLYDIAGRCREFHHSEAGTIRYIYEGMHLTSIERYSQEGAFQYSHHYTEFDPNGHVHLETLPFGLGEITTEHDHFERTTKQTSRFASQEIHYDPAGLVTKLESTLFGAKHYNYDALSQLTQENDTTYDFDSLGNQASCHVNDLNQILTGPGYSLEYDRRGNPIRKTTSTETLHYKYDALGRLIEISTPEKTVHYQYDPISRLHSKEIFTAQSFQTVHYLYDNAYEIGTVSEDGRLLDFRVLGLGIKGDIGAAIAIEINTDVFIPLHDFRGNVIALLSPDGTIAETTNFDAFGQGDTPHRNPWGFSSKRTEEAGLIFFGLRFYDPALQRFLTPDPSGFADGPNLYLFTLNSPLNRLDLFGLSSDTFQVPLHIDVDLKHLVALPYLDHLILPCTIRYGNRSINTFCSFFDFHKLNFSPHELETGIVDLLPHMPEFISPDARGFGIYIFGNGINVPRHEAIDQLIGGLMSIPNRVFAVGLYQRSDGIVRDFARLCVELTGYETHMVKDMKNILMGLSERLQAISTDVKMLLLMHSKSGITTYQAYQNAPKDSKDLMNSSIYYAGYGLVRPIPNEMGIGRDNVYSRNDWLTLSLKCLRNWFKPCHDIRKVDCISSWRDKTGFVADHAFMAPTAQKTINEMLSDLKKDYGFYETNTR